MGIKTSRWNKLLSVFVPNRMNRMNSGLFGQWSAMDDIRIQVGGWGKRGWWQWMSAISTTSVAVVYAIDPYVLLTILMQQTSVSHILSRDIMHHNCILLTAIWYIHLVKYTNFMRSKAWGNTHYLYKKRSQNWLIYREVLDDVNSQSYSTPSCLPCLSFRITPPIATFTSLSASMTSMLLLRYSQGSEFPRTS